MAKGNKQTGFFNFMNVPPEPPRPLENMRPEIRAFPPDTKFAAVALDRPFVHDFTYRIPTGMNVEAGMRVAVPLGARREIGVVTSIVHDPGCDPSKVKLILHALDREPVLDASLIECSSEIAREWACGRGQALAAMLPASLRNDRNRRTTWVVHLKNHDFDSTPAFEEKEPDRYRLLRVLRDAGGEMGLQELCRATKLTTSPVKTLAKRGFLQLEKRVAQADPLLLTRPSARSTPPPLTEEQQQCVAAISQAARERVHEVFLLLGITGSGKTEVYLRSLEETVRSGRGAIVLVPEISLTPQTVERFRSRFDDVTVLHSKLTDAERMDQWRAIQSGRSRLVVGARSAIFAPVRDLGIIIVDEEHEPSFKQSNTPRYHARDVAVMRGRIARAAVVLGSATPSLETWHRAITRRITLLRLTRRVAGGALPPVRIADLRHERARELNLGSNILMTRPLQQAIEKALSKKQRAILFINRRGFAPVLWCSGCSATMSCERCAVSLTFHQRIERLVCHLCGREAPVPADCKLCNTPRPRFLGAGTERVEQMVQRAFRNAHVARMDSDTTTARGSHESILDRFRSGEIDILVGTQMIAKGLDVPEVTVVGVVDADATLHIPEFTSSERTFQLVAQVAGRAGRGDAAGEVFVQTSMPGHPAIAHASRHDFESFASYELAERKRHRYPPFVRFVRVLAEHLREDRARDAVEAASRLFTEMPEPGIEVLGPSQAPIAKIKSKHRYHFILRFDPPERIDTARLRILELASRVFGGVRLTVDVDPAGTM